MEIMQNVVSKGYYEDGLKNVKQDLENIKKNYLSLGFHLKEIKEYGWYKHKYSSENFDKYCKDEFGLSKSTALRLIQINERFCISDSCDLKEEFKNFSQSQLTEILPLSDYDIQYVRPDMTIKEIRQLKSYEMFPQNEIVQVPGQMEVTEILSRLESLNKGLSESFIATSRQVDSKPCLHSVGNNCNMSNHHDVAEAQGINCPHICCWGCNFDLCGARCNPSVNNNYQSVSEHSYVEQRHIELISLYSDTKYYFEKYNCLPAPGSKRKFKFGDYEMTIELKN